MSEIKPGDVVRHVLNQKYPRTAKVLRVEPQMFEDMSGTEFTETVAVLDGIIRDIDHYPQDDPNKGYWEFVGCLEVTE